MFLRRVIWSESRAPVPGKLTRTSGSKWKHSSSAAALASISTSALGSSSGCINPSPDPRSRRSFPRPSRVVDGGSLRLAARCESRTLVSGHYINHLAGASADLGHRRADRPGHLPNDLGVVVDGVENTVEDPGDVVEAHLEQHLRLDALDRQLHAAERRVNADVQLQQVEDI